MEMVALVEEDFDEAMQYQRIPVGSHVAIAKSRDGMLLRDTSSWFSFRFGASDIQLAFRLPIGFDVVSRTGANRALTEKSIYPKEFLHAREWMNQTSTQLASVLEWPPGSCGGCSDLCVATRRIR